MAITRNFTDMPIDEAPTSGGDDSGGRIWDWLGRLIGNAPHKYGIRQVYAVENQDWLAPKSNLSEAEAYKAILDLYTTVSEENYRTAIARMEHAGPPEAKAAETRPAE